MTKNIDFIDSPYGFFLFPHGKTSGAISFGNKIQEFDRQEQNTFYWNDYFLNHPKPWKKCESFFEMPLSDFQQSLPQKKFTTSQKLAFHIKLKDIFSFEKIHPETEKVFPIYKNMYEFYFQKIQNLELKKAVPFGKFEFPYESFNDLSNPVNLIPFEEFMNFILRMIQLFIQKMRPDFYLYGHWNFAQQEFYIGCSPEFLFEKNKKDLYSCAIAGTFLKSEFAEKTVPFKKIREEHEITRDEIKKILNQFAKFEKQNEIIVEHELFTHLKTNFKFKLENTLHIDDLIKKLHPSPALGCFPKNKLLEQTAERLFYSRQYYGAPFGFFGKKTLFIGLIRGIYLNQKKLIVYCGGGITSQSQIQEEWKEILAKLQSVIS